MPGPWTLNGYDYSTVFAFGDSSDRVIETVGSGKAGRFEVGYYNGVGKPKAIINISPAVGCPVGCNFCDLEDLGSPLSAVDMAGQVSAMATIVQQVDGLNLKNTPLKVNFAKTGEPVFNREIPASMLLMAEDFRGVSFKYSSSMPRARYLNERINQLAQFAAHYNAGSVQLTISLISTNEEFRLASAKPGMLASFKEIRGAIDTWHETNPGGRMPNCSLLVGEDTPCDPNEVKDIFPPDLVRFRIRKIVPTSHSERSGIDEASDAKIGEVMQRFADRGYKISDAGLPTPTEATFALASNVTRRRLGEENFPTGVIENSGTLVNITPRQKNK